MNKYITKCRIESPLDVFDVESLIAHIYSDILLYHMFLTKFLIVQPFCHNISSAYSQFPQNSPQIWLSYQFQFPLESFP